MKPYNSRIRGTITKSALSGIFFPWPNSSNVSPFQDIPSNHPQDVPFFHRKSTLPLFNKQVNKSMNGFCFPSNALPPHRHNPYTGNSASYIRSQPYLTLLRRCQHHAINHRVQLSNRRRRGLEMLHHTLSSHPTRYFFTFRRSSSVQFRNLRWIHSKNAHNSHNFIEYTASISGLCAPLCVSRSSPLLTWISTPVRYKTSWRSDFTTAFFASLRFWRAGEDSSASYLNQCWMSTALAKSTPFWKPIQLISAWKRGNGDTMTDALTD